MNETERINEEPQIHVGVMTRPEITVCFTGTYIGPDGLPADGEQTLRRSADGVEYRGTLYPEALFTPEAGPESSFELRGVTIGIGFHWQRAENQRFAGALRVIPSSDDPSGIIAVNEIGLEEYLKSVISSEMNATSSLEFLKAHAVVSRSWLFAQIEKRKALSDKNEGFFSFIKTDTEYIRWYDREDHTIFDVCADDHCQRYQGITKASSAAVTEAVRATRGQLLMYERGICDARFSKCCGGASEEFGYCWEDKNYPYLSTIRDAEEEENRPLPDLTKEEEAERWIRTSPVSFCDTHDKKVISQILNNYDQETTDFYRWKVRYSQAELSELIRQNTKSDYGDIIDLIPIQRGKSGRICKLKIVGSLKTLTIGKELEIRRTLSSSHLFSSAFVIDKGELKNGVPEWFLLTGAGWGHGVGLCQIGAAVMGERGYTYDEILLHYYKGADIRRFY